MEHFEPGAELVYRCVDIGGLGWMQKNGRKGGKRELEKKSSFQGFSGFYSWFWGRQGVARLGPFSPFPFSFGEKKKRKRAPPLQFLSMFSTVSFPLFPRQVRPEGICPSSLRRSHLGREGAELRGTQSGIKSRTASCSCRNYRGRIQNSS